MENNTPGDIAAIFDLDGTLYTGHITMGLAEHHRTRRVKRFELYTYMLTHMPIWWLQRLVWYPNLRLGQYGLEIWVGQYGAGQRRKQKEPLNGSQNSTFCRKCGRE